ncbi:Rgg/GadR/MutR family transcriptional regulator [Streptococcus massiliensis]|uniref:Transcriptional regulator n=1 Tax=Streptococcus massiliensis TaxID=313439 RepID=A0A380KZH1_9STRE|nr:Rgg/GadR/MutR family transcriptional regulator [Streptococcus massiliensis]SUN76336.1 transcriptional regulator [Streptococcus massiliensis]
MQDLFHMGQIFKELRIGRNISLKEATGDQFSYSMLSRFENGESDLSAQKLLVALENIRTDLSEFVYLVRGFKPTAYTRLKREIWHYQEKKDQESLTKLYEQEITNYQANPKQPYHLLNAILIKGHMVMFDESIEATSEELSFLYDYLFSVEIWGLYELSFFADVSPLLNLDLYFRYTREMLQRVDFFVSLEEHRTYIQSILLNGFLKSIDEKNSMRASYFQKKIEEYSFTENSMYLRTVHLFATGQFEHVKGNQAQGVSKMKDAIRIFRLLNCTESADYYEEGLKAILKI